MTNPKPSPLKHIRCVPGDIAPIVFLPGDPGRVKRIAAQNGATNVRLVGSVARGEETDGSDIDLLVDFNPGRSLFDHAQLVEDLKTLLGVSVGVVSSRGLKPKVRERLLRDARPI